MPPPRAAAGYLALLVTALGWSGTWITARAAANEAAPLAVAAVRFATAALVLLPVWFLLARGKAPARLAWRDAPLVLGMALTGVVGYTVLFLTGINHAPASDGAVITPGMGGVFSMLLAWPLLKQRPRRAEAVGAALATLGVVLVGWSALRAAEAGSTRLWGDAVLVLAAAVWGVHTVIGRRASDRIHAVTGILLASVLGTAILLPLVLAVHGPGAWAGWSGLAWGNALYLGVAGTAVAFVTFYFGVQRVGVARAAPFFGLVPVFAVALAALFLGEALTPLHALGGLLVLAGIAWPGLAQRREAKAAPAASAPTADAEEPPAAVTRG